MYFGLYANYTTMYVTKASMSQCLSTHNACWNNTKALLYRYLLFLSALTQFILNITQRLLEKVMLIQKCNNTEEILLYFQP